MSPSTSSSRSLSGSMRGCLWRTSFSRLSSSRGAGEQRVHELGCDTAHVGQERKNSRPFVQKSAAVAFGSRQAHGLFEASQRLFFLAKGLLRQLPAECRP